MYNNKKSMNIEQKEKIIKKYKMNEYFDIDYDFIVYL